MATDVTVGMDPYDAVIRVNFDDVETGRRVQAEMDENAAEEAARLLREGGGLLQFTDTITGMNCAIAMPNTNKVADLLQQAAVALRAHKAGEVDMRLAGTVKTVPKA